MLKFSEMKTKTKILSGVLMSAMLLGAALPTLAKTLEESKENYAPHLMNYEEFYLNQGFSSDSIQQYPEIDALILTDISIHELMTEEYLLQLAFWGELELPRHGESGKEKHDWEQQTWLTPAEITYTDGTKEDTIITGFFSNGVAFGTSYNVSVSTQIQKKDISSVLYLGTTFKLENTSNSETDPLTFTPPVEETSAFLMEGTENEENWQELLAEKENIQYSDLKIIEVSPEDENKFTPEQWEENQQSNMVVYDQEEVSERLLSSAKQMSQEELEFLRLGISPEDESNYSSEDWTALMKQIMDGEIPLLLPSEAKTWHVSEQGISWYSE